MRINCRRNRAGRQCCARQTPPCPHGSFNQALNIDTIFLMLKILQICPIFLRIKISLIRMVYNALYNLVSVCISRFLVLKALNLLFFFFLLLSLNIMLPLFEITFLPPSSHFYSNSASDKPVLISPPSSLQILCPFWTFVGRCVYPYDSTCYTVLYRGWGWNPFHQSTWYLEPHIQEVA